MNGSDKTGLNRNQKMPTAAEFGAGVQGLY